MARTSRPGAQGRASLAALLPALFLAVPAAAQAPRRLGAPALHVEAGWVALSTPWVKDDNGTTVEGDGGPSIGAGAAWKVATQGSVGVDVRLTRAGVTIRGAGNGDIDGGHSTAIDLLGTLGFAVSPRLAVHGGVGVTHLVGNDAIAPFAAGNASPWRLGAEAGAQVALLRRWPLALAATVHGMRVGNASSTDPVTSPGAVTRVLVGVRYGR